MPTYRTVVPAALLVAGALAAALAAGPVAQAPAAAAGTREVTDELGRRVRLPETVGRIVSLAPSLTETLYALGAEDRLVAVTDFCDYPPAARAKPRVGGAINPSLEAIVAARPDLVLMTRSHNRRETAVELERLGLPVYVTDPRSVGDIIASVSRLGQLLGSPRAEELAAEMRRRLAALSQTLVVRRPRRVLFVVWDEPLISVGPGTFVADALRHSGAESIVTGEQEWPRLSLEEVARLDPDFLIFAVSHSASVRELAASLGARPGWRKLRAVREGRIAATSDAINRPAPRIVDAIEELARQLHPDAFRKHETRNSKLDTRASNRTRGSEQSSGSEFRFSRFEFRFFDFRVWRFGGSRMTPLTPRRLLAVCCVLTAILFLVSAAALKLGAVPIAFGDLVMTLYERALGRPGPLPSHYQMILLEIRLPRILMGILVGAALAVAGAGFQALLRNPLADPYVLGVSSGAALGAIVALAVLPGLAMAMPLAAFAGAVVTISGVYFLGRRGGQLDSYALLLAGIITASFLSAVIMFLMTTLPASELRGMSFWLMGELSRSAPVPIGWLYGVAALAVTAIYFTGADLNLMLTGEQEARHLGVEVGRVKVTVYLAASVLTGLAVAVAGAIGFVGLLVPHVMRLIVGSDYRMLVPAAALGGAIVVVVADVLARTVVAPSELPVGAMTAMAGAPVFLYLLRRRLR